MRVQENGGKRLKEVVVLKFWEKVGGSGDFCCPWMIGCKCVYKRGGGGMCGCA